ncbi:MAG: apolipoprotein N-acyltransferase [Nitratireductor sp.]|nr:apolipoprotein N-acyltransferase [Nitratireductor sp.]
MGRLEKLAGWFILLEGWRRLWAAFALGLISALALAPVDLVPVMFVTLPGLVFILDGVYGDARRSFFRTLLAAFAPGWWFGFGYLLGGLWWIGNALLVEAELFAWALPLAILVLPAGLALFFGLATVIARMLWSEGWGRVMALAFALGATEFLRGTVLTGFPWNTLGYTAMPAALLMQSASVVGVYGMTVLAVPIFALPLVTLAGPGRGRALKRPPLLLALLLLAAHTGFGAWRLATNPEDNDGTIRIRLMQPDIDQREKLTPGNEALVLATYLDVSRQAPAATGGEASGLNDIDYLIWPESAFPFLLTEEPQALAAIAELLPAGTRLITGALRAEPGAAGNPRGKVYNSVFVISDAGEIEEASDKTHLVPFGEYLPFQDLLEAIGLEQLTRVQGGFEPGSQRRVLQAASSRPFLPLICYEVVFSGAIRDNPTAQSAASWIVNLTNDAWFGHTPGPYQHLRQTRVRAVEEGLPIVRAANTGISAIIDPMGRLVAKLPVGMRGTADGRLPAAISTTFFIRFGTWIFATLLAISLAGSLLFRGRRSN